MTRALAWNVSSVLCALWLGACAGATHDAVKTAAAGTADQAPDASADVSTIEKDLPTTLDGEIRRAQLLRSKGDYDDAGRALAQMMLVAPDNPKVVSEYGKLLVQQGRPRDAISFLDRAIQLQPKDWTLYSALGVAYDQNDDHAHARVAYEHALTLSPGEPTVLNNLAVSRVLAGNLPDAQKYLAEASTHTGASPKIANNLAMLAGMKGPESRTQAKPATAASSAVGPQPAAQTARKPVAARLAVTPPKALLDDSVVMQKVPADPLAGPIRRKPGHFVRLAHAIAKEKQVAHAAPSPPALRTAAEAD